MNTYTLEEMLELPAGPDIDLCIAEEVCGWEFKKYDTDAEGLERHVPCPPGGPLDLYSIPKYSTSWADAGPLLELTTHAYLMHDGRCWNCTFRNQLQRANWQSAQTPMLAICRAALVWASERGKKE